MAGVERANGGVPAGVCLVGTDEVDPGTGSYVVRRGPTQQLLPGGLARLLEFAERHRLDAVAGRQHDPYAPLTALFLRDRPLVEGADAAEALAAPVLLRRRTPGDDAGLRVGVVADCIAVEQAGTPVRALPVTVDRSRLEWRDHGLAVTVAGSVSAPDDLALQPVIVVRSTDGHVDRLLPTDGSVEVAGALLGRPWTAAAVCTALDEGEWRLDVLLAGPQQGTVAMPIPPTELPPGRLGSAPAVIRRHRGGARIEVGVTSKTESRGRERRIAKVPVLGDAYRRLRRLTRPSNRDREG